MTFVSYAQNREDVVLWRALKDVEQGFYIDIGAADPDVDSVTKAFYERGWVGINVEPVGLCFERLQAARPRDLNICVAAGARAEVRTLHVVAETGLSTLDPTIARRHSHAGFMVTEVPVPIMPLAEIVRARPMPSIHFLKIDVEGAEADVLFGADLDGIRPWIIVVEATEPNSQIPTRHCWEHLILDHHYEFAYFDGLYCFYVASERSELKQRLAVQPNVFDNFVPNTEHRLCQEVAELTPLREQVAELASLREQITELASLRERVVELQDQVAGLAPLREQVAELAESAALVPQLRGRLRRLRAERVDTSAELSRLRGIAEQLRSSLAGAVTALAKRDKDNARQSAEITALAAERLRLIADVCELTAQARALRSSRSWRLTSPLRVAGSLARQMLSRSLSSPPTPASSPLSPTPDLASPVTTERNVVADPPGGDDRRQARLDDHARIILHRLEAVAKMQSTAPDA